MAERATRVLVVDDNEAERYYLCRVLGKAGYAIQEGGTGEDALRLARELPDLITLDVRLPDINGFEVCRRLKEDVATRDIPILHISASFTTPEARAEGLEGGADGYLTHPVDPGELLATVRALLRTRTAEARVRAAAREWATTFDLIEDPVCLTSGNGIVARCNQAFARWLARPFQEIVGQPLGALVPQLAPVVAEGKSGVVEVQIAGRHFRVSSGAGTPGIDGESSRAWVLGDVTERRRSEESLRLSEERAQTRLAEIEAIYNAAPIGLCVLDRDLRFVRINKQMAAMNGIPVEETLGRTVREVLPDLADLLEPRLRTVLETGRPLLGHELAGQTPAQPGIDRVWIEHWYPLRAPDGTVMGINIATEEVTEQRRAQEHLQQAQRLEAVGRLAGGVAHEANNQMTVVLGCANFALRDPGLSRELRADLEQIRRAAERTSGITAQLLAFGRRQHTRPVVTDLNEAVNRLEPILTRAVGPLATVRLRLAGAPARVMVDPGQFDQVLINLAINSRDAMPDGGTLTLRTDRIRIGAPMAERFVGEQVAPGDYVRVVVTDTGSGMDETTLERAFEPFFTTKHVGHGTGLGLSMVYGIVRQAGGYVAVASQPGAGTEVALYFPLSDPLEPHAAEDAESVAVRPGRAILLVEDDEAVRAVLARELQSHGYEVLEAPDGRAALEILRQRPRDLDAVVTDVQMPGMDGRRLAERLGTLRPELPIVFISGHPEAGLEVELSTGSRPMIRKPFTGEELAHVLERVLKSG